MTRSTMDKQAQEVMRLVGSVELVAHARGRRVYSVASRSHPESPNVVTIWDSGETRGGRCTCEAGEHRRRCVHLAAALLVEDSVVEQAA